MPSGVVSAPGDCPACGDKLRIYRNESGELRFEPCSCGVAFDACNPEAEDDYSDDYEDDADG